jgi:mycofactocin system glycosyltransferase
MSGFVFTLAGNTGLENNPQGGFLVSRSPIRTLRVNRSLYTILRKIEAGKEGSDLISSQSGLPEGRLWPVLLSLTYRGYLRLEKIADIEDYPSVSVVIPTNRLSADLVECLESVDGLDYPREKLEVLLVEDAAPPNPDIRLARFGIKRIGLQKAQGPATARNIGAEEARGEILAFLDADCIADKNWLKETIPFFQVEGLGAVGGFVEGYYKKSFLDRYEEVSSSLNMGPRLLFEGNTSSNFYVPTCNMLVRRKAFEEAGGFNGGMRLGEDVDFCWRMRKQGYSLLYLPAGKVAHKHRNRLGPMLARRSAYGSSEASLYRLHKDKRKRFLVPLWAALSFLALVVAILLKNPYPLAAIPIFLAIDMVKKSTSLRRFQIALPIRRSGLSTLRSHFSFYYYTSFHLVRYYLILLLALGALYRPLFFLCIFLVLLTSSVDYAVKKPRLLYPVFLFYHVLEHLAYQAGVFGGCLKLRYFGSYLLVFKRR